MNHKSHAVEATNQIISKPNTFKTTVSRAKCPICGVKKANPEPPKSYCNDLNILLDLIKTKNDG